MNFENIEIFKDDGETGTTSNRDAFDKLLKLIEDGIVKTLIVKDLSRLFRNHHEADKLIEVTLPMKEVRLIAINNGIGTKNGENEVVPFLRTFTNKFLIFCF